MTLTIQQHATPDRSMKHYWNWRVWIEGSDAELDEIRSVRYQLHYTFPDPTREVKSRATKFALKSSGWGEFTIYAAVRFKDSTRDELPLNHWLRLGGSPKDPTPVDSLKGIAPSVFVSSSFADVHLANSVAEALRARDVRILNPYEPNPPGVSFAKTWAGKTEEADVAVMIVGDKGRWADQETKRLLADEKDIIPVVLVDAVPDRIRELNPIWIKPGEPAEAIADRIIQMMPALKGESFSV